MRSESIEPPADAPVERGLHPLSWLFSLLTHARGLVLPAAALLVTARWTNIDILFLPAAIAVLVNALVQQLSLRYELGADELIVRRNIIVHRSERHIPYTRVHNLRISETPLHRLLHVVEVAVETASGAEPEATLRVLSRSAVDELHARVAQHARGPLSRETGEPARLDATADRRHVVLSLSARDLIVYGLLNNRGFVIAGAVVGLVWEAVVSMQGGQPWDPRNWTAPWSLVRSRGEALVEMAALQSPLWLLGALVAGIALLKLLSMAWALVSLHDFRVERSPGGLIVQRGLFPRTSTLIPLARIQRVVVRERPAYRLTGFVEVRLDTVGGAAVEGRRDPVWLAPVVARTQLSRLLREVGAPGALDAVDWQPLHARAARRMQTRLAVRLSIVAALLWPIVGLRWISLGLVVAVPLALVVAASQTAVYTYASVARYMIIRSGWLWRSTQLTWLDRIQAIAVTSTPFDRRHAMASLLVDTAAGGGLDARLQIPFLGADTADALRRRLGARVARTRFRW